MSKSRTVSKYVSDIYLRRPIVYSTSLMYSSDLNVKIIILKIGKNLRFCELLSFKKHLTLLHLTFKNQTYIMMERVISFVFVRDVVKPFRNLFVIIFLVS